MKKCLNCGVEFEPKNPKGVFCSSKCKVAFGRKKKKGEVFDAPKIDPKTIKDEPPQIGVAFYDNNGRRTGLVILDKNKNKNIFADVKISNTDKLPDKISALKKFKEDAMEQK